MKKSNALFCLLFIGSLIFSSAVAQDTFHTTTSTVIGYLQYLPQDYNNNSDKYPVVIFLHGLGERGVASTDPATLETTISIVERNGPPKLVKNGTQFPFILISPQLKNNFGDWQSWYVKEVIDYVKTYLRIDERRIYLTGLSLGGGGTWWTAQDFPKEFAAIAPVCGSRNTLSKACLLSAENLPVWAFHGDSDTTVPYMRTVNMVNAINACTPAPNPLAKMTIYPGINHNCWDLAYTNDHSVQTPSVYEWMLSYTNIINGSNRIPIANAGADVSKNIPVSSVVLTGSGTDSDGTIASYSWTQLAGPSTATLTNATTASVTASALVPGTYVFKVIVTDNSGDIDADFVNVTIIPNVLPTANAGTDQTIILPTSSVTLTGSASDPDGTIASYQWTEVSGSSATLSGTTTSTLSASSLTSGSYVFRLTVKDNLGGTRSDDIIITVDPAQSTNVPPVAGAGPDRLVKLPSDPITLFGTASDADGTIVKYEWVKVSGGPCTLTSTSVLRPKVSGLVTGKYVFRLTLTDNDGATASDDVTITADYAPVVDAGVDQNITLPTNSVTLTGTASDADGTITSYLWVKTAGPTTPTLTNKTTPTVTASGLVAGTYQLRFTVTDNVGAQTVDYVTIVVAASAGRAATASIDTDDTSNTFLLLDDNKMNNASATIYNQNGQKIYEGKWNRDVYDRVMNQKGMYIYNVVRDGNRTSGKVYITQE